VVRTGFGTKSYFKPAVGSGAAAMGSAFSGCFGGLPRVTMDVFQGVNFMLSTASFDQHLSTVSLRTVRLLITPCFVMMMCSSLRASRPTHAP
jgi:hypothetical protein